MNKLLGTFLVVLMVLFYQQNLMAGEAEIGNEAPEFSLTDSKGETHKLSDFSGKFVVLEWINFDCPFVKKHYNSKNMQMLQEKYTEKGVVWLAVCSSAEGKQGNYGSEEINKKAADLGANFTAYLVDESGNVGKAYGAKTTPHMFVISPDGILLYAGGIDDIPSTDVDDIEKAVNYVDKALTEAINGNKVTIKTSPPYGCSVKY